jgi:hypothetical protein
LYSCIACLMDDMFSIVKLLNCKFKVKIYIILVFPSSAVLKPAQAGLVFLFQQPSLLRFIDLASMTNSALCREMGSVFC